MTGRTNYPAPSNGDLPDGPTQIDALGEHFDELIGETAANAAALPTSDLFVGRMVTTTDTFTVYICTEASGSGTWQTLLAPPVFCSLGMSAAQNSASGGVPAAVTWDVEVSDVQGLHDNSTNKDRITIPTGGAGLYLIHVSVTLNTAASGHYAIGDLTVAASGTPTTQVAILGTAKTVPVVSTINTPTWEATAIVTLAVGDIVRLRIADASATAIIVASSGIQVQRLLS